MRATLARFVAGLVLVALLFTSACDSGPRTTRAALPAASAMPGAAAGAVGDDARNADIGAPSIVVPPTVTDVAAEAAPADAEAPPAVCGPLAAGTQPAPVRVGAAPPSVAAAAAVVIDGGSGVVLWGRDEHVQLQPASVTKILTGLIAIERGNLDEVITVDLEQRLLSRGSTMGLITGDWFTLRDLLYGLMLPSGNDAAAVIAQHFAGGEREFAALMNERLCRMGLNDSTYINPSGLGRGEYNLASAFDLAQTARVAMDLPAFREVVGARTWVARGSRTIAMRNLNELVSGYPGADGVKIGWTPGAGNTIVGSATRNGHRVIVALLNTPNRAAESAALLTWAFSAYSWGD